MALRDLEDWKPILKEYDLIWGPVPKAQDVARDPQAQLNGVYTEIAPGLRTIQNPLNVEGTEKTAPRMPPAVGVHTSEVLAELGCSADQIADLLARGVAMAAAG